MQLISLVPTDPTVLQRLGDMYEDSDKSQSFQYYLEVTMFTVMASYIQVLCDVLKPYNAVYVIVCNVHMHKDGVIFRVKHEPIFK